MISTIHTRRDAYTDRDVTKTAYNNLLKFVESLHQKGSINDEERKVLETGLTEIYLERIAAKYVDKKIGFFMEGFNDQLCSAISTITDPHKNNEHINVNYKLKKLRILHSYGK